MSDIANLIKLSLSLQALKGAVSMDGSTENRKRELIEQMYRERLPIKASNELREMQQRIEQLENGVFELVDRLNSIDGVYHYSPADYGVLGGGK